MRTTSALILSCLLLAGCQFDPWANGFLTGQAAEKDVVGTYLIDADSQKRTIRLPFNKGNFPINGSARIVLSSDHTAEFIHVPEDFRGTEACSVTGRGSWQIGKNDSFTVVRARIINEEPTSRCQGDFDYELDLYGKKPPYKLHITIGDPDSGMLCSSRNVNRLRRFRT